MLVRNVRGLNMRARRSVVRELLLQERVGVLCLVETKIEDLSLAMANDLMGTSFDYVLLPSVGASGGIIVALHRDDWSSPHHATRQFSVTIRLEPIGLAAAPWSLSVVYGPVVDDLKTDFLAELRQTRAASQEPLLLCGDFSMIYQARDKSNDRLNLRMMRRFRRALDELQVEELYLHGRLYTWSNERRRPTLERIDRAFAIVPWLEAFPQHHLRPLSSEC